MYYRRNAKHKSQIDYCEWRNLKTAMDIINRRIGGHLPSGLLAGATTEEFYENQIGMARLAILRVGNSPDRGALINWYMQAKSEQQLYRNRQPFIKLYPQIAEMLSTTSINIPCNEIHLPFDAFTIQLPRVNDIKIAGIEGNPDENLCAILISTPDEQIKRDVGFTGKALQIQWQTTTFYDPEPLLESLIILLSDDSTIEEQIETSISESKKTGIKTTDDEIRTVFRIAIGAIFLAISRDRRYVNKERIKVRGNDPCFCGSGLKYKRCCKRQNIQHVGLGVGKEISLPHQGTSSQEILTDEEGRRLQHSHLRSGHMRWQRFKDKDGEWQRKLIFIHPQIVRPDLPPRSGGPTSRGINRPPSKRWNPQHPQSTIYYDCMYCRSVEF